MLGKANPGFGSKKLKPRKKKKSPKRLILYVVIIAVLGIIFVNTDIYSSFSDSNKENESNQNQPATNSEPQQTVVKEVKEEKTTNSATETNVKENQKENITKTIVQQPVVKEPQTKIDKEEHKELNNLYYKALTSFKNGDLLKAKKLAYKIIDKVDIKTTAWAQAAEIIGNANTEIFFTDYISPEKTIYTVKPGDSLDKLAKKFSTTLEAIQISNDIPKTTSTINVGQKLVIYKGFWKIIISKKKFRLYLYDNNKLFKVYKIATGKGNKTPTGKFVISSKIRKPAWTYNGKKYPYGSPENVLGTRWMQIRPAKDNPNKQLSGYGIHGTWDPKSIGSMASNGCIRMENSNIEELFAIIPKYTNPNGNLVPVIINEE
jgi:lipoprotein-anchoring transpeptidase ErfK/SrfK